MGNSILSLKVWDLWSNGVKRSYREKITLHIKSIFSDMGTLNGLQSLKIILTDISFYNVYRPFLQVKWTKNGCFLRKFWFFVSSCSISIILGLLGLLVLGTLICVDKYRPNLRFTRLITRLSISRRVTSHRFKFWWKNLKPNDKIKLTQNQFKFFFTPKKILKRKIWMKFFISMWK